MLNSVHVLLVKASDKSLEQTISNFGEQCTEIYEMWKIDYSERVFQEYELLSGFKWLKESRLPEK